MTFASTLFEKVPRAAPSGTEKRRQENRAKEQKALESQNKRYALVESDDEDTSLKIQPKKVKKSKKEKKKKTSDHESEDEFDKAIFLLTKLKVRGGQSGSLFLSLQNS
jgi:hypothetical protein